MLDIIIIMMVNIIGILIMVIIIIFLDFFINPFVIISALPPEPHIFIFVEKVQLVFVAVYIFREEPFQNGLIFEGEDFAANEGELTFLTLMIHGVVNDIINPGIET